MAQPLVSVIIPTYNYQHYITEAIESILQQTYPLAQIEIIVVDDGSTDKTQEVLQSFIERQVIQYYYQDNKGKANATKHGIEKSSGKYVFNLDADDYFLPKKIEHTVAVFESDPSIVHVASPAKFISKNREVTSIEQFPEDILEKSLDGNWLLHRFYNNHILFGGGSTFAARASALKQIHIPDEVDMYMDEFLIMAILLYGNSFFIREPLSVWREHNSNYSGTVNTKERKLAKGERLLRSSAGVLQYVENHDYGDRIKKIYQLIDANRWISYKETTNSKTLNDIIVYIKKLCMIKPDWTLIKNYFVLNRLIPLPVYKLVKRLYK